MSRTWVFGGTEEWTVPPPGVQWVGSLAFEMAATGSESTRVASVCMAMVTCWPLLALSGASGLPSVGRRSTRAEATKDDALVLANRPAATPASTAHTSISAQ